MSSNKKTPYRRGQRDLRGDVTVKPGTVARAPRKSGKQMLKELPIAHLSPARRKALLLELIDVYLAAAEDDTPDTHRECMSVLEKFDVDVTPLDV
jgi:hypothetical protein